MSKRSLLAVAVCAAVAGLSAGPAFAGEVTGNGKATQGPANANSICVFSGQNDDPSGTQGEGPGGRTQSYGQDVKLGLASPSSVNPGKVEGPIPQPGFACNGDHGFFSEG